MYVVQVDTVERQSLLATRNNWVMGGLLSIVDFCPLMRDGTGIVDFVGRGREYGSRGRRTFFWDRGDTASGRAHAFTGEQMLRGRMKCVGMNSSLSSVVSQSRGSRNHDSKRTIRRQLWTMARYRPSPSQRYRDESAFFSLQAPTSFT